MLNQYITKLISKLNLSAEHESQLLDYVSNKIKQDSWGSYYETINKLFNINTQADTQKNSVAIQLVFWAFDLVDDVVDDDQLLKWISKEQQIVLSHIVMLQGLRMFQHDMRDEVMDLIVKAGYAEFQDITFDFQYHSDISEDDYLNLVQQKSGQLMQLIALIIDKHNEPLNQFMLYIGVAAQIKNDIDSILSLHKNDFNQKKMYLPLIKYIYFSGDSTLQHYSRENIQKSGSLDYCRLLYNYYIEKAYSILLDAFPDKSEGIRKLKNEFNF
ncbi:class 1 isoprenoid biosynthesis enzyme [Macrococcus capreoli]|uniref:class 1 isoprenoid biosynthesis enzyme n=1 Tax=Macrococcus capreoli TaxID=2982690 RepID=UPI0021D56F61|nr:class 1 isoprenoid biosynthesis enzyme [Macrococcus sp. TMW 2.2395]MCU7557849.1 class 1 isoprenoid biosynthesis enzyme [Macrococcus sp. TMW 2.2395]